MPDTTLQLGDFTFTRYEVPEQIGFGGEQKLIVHELVGGARVVDAMGDQPIPLEWSGIFTGPNALDRALYIDGLRKAGKALTLAWSGLRYTVVVRALSCEFRLAYRLPYRITCEVVSDDTTPVASANNPKAIDAVNSDAALIAAQTVNSSTLADLLAKIQAGIAKVNSAINSASSDVFSAVAQVEAPIVAARREISSLLTTAGTAIDAAAAVGGIVSGGFVTAQVAALGAQIGAVSDSQGLLYLDRLLGRMQSNMHSLNAGTKTRQVVSGNLFQIAAQEYGNSAEWASIALANGITDPWITQIAALSIPPSGSEAAGLTYPNAADFIPTYPDDALVDANEIVTEPATEILEDG
jgi:hypothetical protein